MNRFKSEKGVKKNNATISAPIANNKQQSDRKIESKSPSLL
jgi:hypothetical protein